ncbi:DNA-binding IclR family transcriptional regulator [Nocardioides sp. BE266]|uniref:IclR family transcriptional regulator n=1 Tax=Nocardioides sp. BE266 TaxID=2817725 RepID=UPI002855813A|nr:IclR family transcriptional regulator [Nocardioides sp. BE266]MDR7251346.1 DNA-binding IclR family transcriptional regulator [Nocardioides sp. BE266]
MSQEDRTGGSNRVQSIERAAALLRAVAASTGPDGTAAALAEAVGLNRTTTWRILATLEQQRLVTRDDATGIYSLGFGLIDLAGQAGGAALARAAQVVLQGLAASVGETAALAVVRNGTLTYVAEATGGAVVSAGWRDRAVSMHATSTGKVLLAWSEPELVRTLLRLPHGDDLPRHTDATITSLAALEEELVRTRSRGYAVCRGEFETTAWGVSAPVLDVSGRPVAVVSVWGPGDRLTEERFEPLGRLTVAAAEQIAGRSTAADDRKTTTREEH